MAKDRALSTDRLYAANAAAAAFYATRLSSSTKSAAYLDNHGIIAAANPNSPWQLGYAPGHWTDLTTHLQNTGFSPEEITTAGLGFIHRTSHHLLDRFRDRIIFPITDQHNHVIAFTARDLTGRAEARWINTPDTPIYHKRQVLFGLGQQLTHPPTGTGNPLVLLVEGAADVLAICHMATTHTATGADAGQVQTVYAVAPCGTNLTREQLDLLHQALPGAHLVLAFDGDDAGRKAIDRAYPIAVKWPGPTSATLLPDKHDPADLLATMDPTGALRAILATTQPLAQVQMVNTIQRLYQTKHISDPANNIGDRLTAYRAIAELFIDAPHASRQMAETAAEQLGLTATDVTRGVIEAWDARTATTSGPDPPPHPRPEPARDLPPAASLGQARPAVKGATGRTTLAPPQAVTKPQAERLATVSASARSAGGNTGNTAIATRHDPASGISVWALADGIGQHHQATEAAAIAADIATAVALHSTPTAAMHAVRAAINAHYDSTHPSQAGDASLIIVTARTDPSTRLGVHFELAWAGNCRAYTIRAGQLTQTTTDHTATQRRRTAGESIPDSSIAGRLLTSSIRTGDIGTCTLHDGPLLICNAALHRAVSASQLATELAGMCDAQAAADRLTTTAAHQTTDAAVLLIHATDAPPSRVTTTAVAATASVVSALGDPAALAHNSFANPAAPAPTALARNELPAGGQPRQAPYHR